MLSRRVVELRAAKTLGSLNAIHPGWMRLLRPGRRDETSQQHAAAQADETAVRRMEAVLFLSQTPLSTRKLAKMCGLPDGTRARTLIRQLNEEYERRAFAFHAAEVAGGVQLLTRPRYAPWLRKSGVRVAAPRLSAPAMETLAVVAYLQPVLRADVEAIRGVQCGEILKQLMARELVRIRGRSQELGRPYLYGTTKEFLAQFGLKNLDELPAVGHPRHPDKSDILSPSPAAPPSQTADHSASGASEQAREAGDLESHLDR